MGQFRSAATIPATRLIGDFPSALSLAQKGPLEITSRGRASAMLLSSGTYQALAGAASRSGPNAGSALAWLADASGAGLFLLGENLAVTHASPAACEGAGLNRDAVIGSPLSGIPGLDDPRVARRLKDIMLAGAQETFTAPMSPQSDVRVRYAAMAFPGGIAIAVLSDASGRDSKP